MTPAGALVWLDAYEGIMPGNHASNDYVRVERAAQLATGQDVAVWVYVYLKRRGVGLIAGGRWPLGPDGATTSE